MATTTQNDNRAKFLELRKQGISVADARNQTYGPAPVVADQTPTAPLIPTPTVAPITSQEVQQGVNAVGGTAEQRRETRSGIVAGQQIAPPPTPTSVPTRTPETPVQTPPTVQVDTAPVTPKVDATPGITQDAFQQAKIESEKIKAQNDAAMAQNQQKSELARQDEARKAEALIPKDEKSVLNALISGISVPKQNTQAYRNAEVKANNYRKYASMTPTQLLDNMKMGEISTEMDSLLASNPNYAQAKQKLNEFQKTQNLNKTMSNIVGGIKGKDVTVTTPEQEEEDISSKIMKKYGLDDANASAFAQFIATDTEMADNKAKLLANRTQLSNVNRQISDTTTLLNQGIKDLKAQYPDMSASGIITLMGSRLGEFNDAITNLNSTKTLLQADIKDEMDLAKSAYDAKSADIQAQNNIRSTMALNEYKSDFEKQQAEAALNDPATAISGVIKEFTDMGIPTTQSLQTKVTDAEKFIAQGGTLAGYVDKMRQDYMNKPEYKALSEYNKRKLAPEVAKPVNPDWKLDAATGQYYDANANVNPSTTIAKNDATSKYGTTPAVRNFNPGNIMDTGFGGRKVAGERFTVFDSPQEGFNALVAKIKNVQAGNSKVYSPEMTLLQYIGKYAPSSDNNNPTAYASAIAKNLNITTGTKIKDIDPVKLAEEHARHEDGNSYRMLKDLGVIGGGTGKQATGSLANLATFMKDNQDRGTGYSNDDVKAFNEKIDRMAKSGDENGMALAYRNMVMKDKDFKKDFDDTQKFATALDSVQKMVSDYEKAGKDTNALKKVAETVGRKLGLTTDTALAQLQTQMGVTMANYIKSISGTAASDAEVARLMGNMANIGNVSELNTAIISTVKDNAMNGIKSMIDTRMYGMPEELKPKVFGDIYGAKTSNSKLSALSQILANLTKNAPKQ